MSQKNIFFLIKVLVAVIVMILLMFLYNRILNLEGYAKEQENKIEEVFSDVENNLAVLELYTVYGNHLNINGYLLKDYLENVTINNMSLILKEDDGQVIEYPLEYTQQEEKYEFTLSENINEGVDLNSIAQGNYYVFLKVNGTAEENNVEKYFSLDNISMYSSNEYYTLTKNNTNNKIDILFNSYLKDDEYSLDYMEITSVTCSLPEDVVDIVIDPGHGGYDGGAVYEDYEEAEFTLEYSMALKEKLESYGFKVALTREEDVYTESYGQNGRAVIPNAKKAKLVLSIHLNSTATLPVEGGVEIYAPNNANLDFAKSFADNIVSYANTRYSVNGQNRVENGVYVWTYSEQDVIDAKEYADYMGYEMYENLTTQTPYLFMIRETGGIMTKAYVDGRNTSIGNNPYYNSNMTAEAYLLELGFINSQADVNNLINNKEAYINAIADSIVSNYFVLK